MALDEGLVVVLYELVDHVLVELVLIILGVEEVLFERGRTDILTTLLQPLIMSKISYSRLSWLDTFSILFMA